MVYYNYLLPYVILTSNSQIRKVTNLEKPTYDFKNTMFFAFLRKPMKPRIQSILSKVWPFHIKGLYLLDESVIRGYEKKT